MLIVIITCIIILVRWHFVLKRDPKTHDFGNAETKTELISLMAFFALGAVLALIVNAMIFEYIEPQTKEMEAVNLHILPGTEDLMVISQDAGNGNNIVTYSVAEGSHVTRVAKADRFTFVIDEDAKVSYMKNTYPWYLRLLCFINPPNSWEFHLPDHQGLIY